ncbi:barstar family protein [Aeromicrobium sp. P5_D10]
MTASYASVLNGTASAGLFSWRGRPNRDLAGEAFAAGWQVLPVDTRDVESIEDFYSRLVAAWGLPEWFGCNLDALFDMLAEQSTTPTVMVWDGLRDLVEMDPVRASAIVEVLRDAVEQTQHLVVVVRDDLGVSGFDALL